MENHHIIYMIKWYYIINPHGSTVKGEERWIAMGCLGNLLWFICGGALAGLGWCVMGCLWCITIIGVPVGLQCFKFAGLSFFPFGRQVVYGGGFGSLILNIIWMIVTGIPMALGHLAIGCTLCLSIIGIPFGLQHFKLMKLALMPFGAEVY